MYTKKNLFKKIKLGSKFLNIVQNFWTLYKIFEQFTKKMDGILFLYKNFEQCTKILNNVQKFWTKFYFRSKKMNEILFLSKKSERNFYEKTEPNFHLCEKNGQFFLKTDQIISQIWTN